MYKSTLSCNSNDWIGQRRMGWKPGRIELWLEKLNELYQLNLEAVEDYIIHYPKRGTSSVVVWTCFLNRRTNTLKDKRLINVKCYEKCPLRSWHLMNIPIYLLPVGRESKTKKESRKVNQHETESKMDSIDSQGGERWKFRAYL